MDFGINWLCSRLKPSAAFAPCWVLVVAISLSVFSGCRTTTDNQMDLLERELRTQEDYIYELEDYVVEYSEKLRQCRCTQPHLVKSTSKPKKKKRTSNSVLKERAPEYEPEEPQPIEIDDEPAFLEEEPAEIPEPTPPALPAVDPEELDVPDLDLEFGEPVGKISREPTILRTVAVDREKLSTSTDAVIVIPDPADYESVENPDSQELSAANNEDLAEETSESLEVEDRRPERIVVAELFRGEPGESPLASMLTVVEALDQHNEPVDFQGDVSVMVMTREDGKPVRVKRWDFTPEEVSAAWQSSHLGDGLHLELPLEEVVLPEESLELWVRFVDFEGRKLLTQIPFERVSLVVLEVETGAQELQPAQLAADDSPTDRGNAKAESPTETSGWRPSLERTDATSQGFSSTVKKASKWTAQSLERQLQSSGVAQAQHQATKDSRPVWTAGRSSRTDSPASAGENQPGEVPQWSPFR